MQQHSPLVRGGESRVELKIGTRSLSRAQVSGLMCIIIVVDSASAATRSGFKRAAAIVRDIALPGWPALRILNSCRTLADLIGIGAAVARRPLPHHRAYGSVHGDSSRLR
jgi:hypothetical protein